MCTRFVYGARRLVNEWQAGFLCSKKRAADIDMLLAHQLKVPSNWPNLRTLLTSTVGIKIADCLALCGDLGAYVIGLTDMDGKFKKIFIHLLNGVLKPLLACSPKDEARLSGLQAEMVMSLSQHCRFIIEMARFVAYFIRFVIFSGWCFRNVGIRAAHILEYPHAPFYVLPFCATNQDPWLLQSTQPPHVRVRYMICYCYGC